MKENSFFAKTFHRQIQHGFHTTPNLFRRLPARSRSNQIGAQAWLVDRCRCSGRHWLLQHAPHLHLHSRYSTEQCSRGRNEFLQHFFGCLFLSMSLTLGRGGGMAWDRLGRTQNMICWNWTDAGVSKFFFSLAKLEDPLAKPTWPRDDLGHDDGNNSLAKTDVWFAKKCEVRVFGHPCGCIIKQEGSKDQRFNKN